MKNFKASDLVKLLKNSEDWGDLGENVRVVKGNVEVLDSFFYGEAKAMEHLVKNWLSETGCYSAYFKEEHGVEFKEVERSSELRATGRAKKLFGDLGVVRLVDGTILPSRR